MSATVNTLAELFYAAVERDLPNLASFKKNGDWVTISTQDFYGMVVATAKTLHSWGIRKGDRVGLLSENRPEWAIADFACMLIGAVDVPLYPTLTPEQTQYILQDSGARAIFVSTAEQLQKIISIRDKTTLEKIVVFDEVGTTEALHMANIMASGPVSRDHAFDETARRVVTGDDLATLIYTSGTTGSPKGVMLSHWNLISNAVTSVQPFRWDRSQNYLSFLPLSHITARHLDYTLFHHGVPIAYCPHVDQLFQYLPEVRPTIFVSVPRVYEKVRTETRRQASAFPKRQIFHWALRVGRRHIADIVAGRRPKSFAWEVANLLVYSKLKEAFGGRVLTFISGGAPLPLELGEWFASAGIRIFEGYGLTETSPVIAVNTPQACKLGTVGRPLPNLEVRIAEDGELLVRGPSVFKQYWNLPEETAKAFDGDWFKTGDIAELDPDGFLKITDRKKDLIKTSGGKFIAPQPIECALRSNALVSQAVVIGERRKFASVLIVPHFPLLQDWAQVNHVEFTANADLVQHPKVRALYDGIVADLNANLAQFEKLKKVILVPDDFSIAGGELTPKMSVRRREVEKKYREQIEALYREPIEIPTEETIIS